MTPLRIIVLLLVSILSICSHALSPELLQQLKQQHIVDTTSTLDNNQIEALKNQNKLSDNTISIGQNLKI